MKKLIGITGPLGSGKTSASEILKEHGYIAVVFSDLLKKEAKKRGLSLTNRKTLQDIGDELRKKYGNDYLAKEILKQAKKSRAELIIVDGIRNLGKLEYVRKKGGYILGITSTKENRYKRVSKKGKLYFGKTHSVFNTDEKRDRGIGQTSYGQQARECLDAADMVVDNNGTLSSFKKQILNIINGS